MLFQGIEVTVRYDADAPDILIEMLRQILDADAEPINRSLQSAGDAESHDATTDRTGHSQEKHRQITLVTGALALCRTFGDVAFVELEQLLARLDDKPNGMPVNNLFHIGHLSSMGLLDELILACLVFFVSVIDLLHKIHFVGSRGDITNLLQCRFKCRLIFVDSFQRFLSRVQEVENRMKSQLANLDFEFLYCLQSDDVLAQNVGEVGLQTVNVSETDQAGRK